MDTAQENILADVIDLHVHTAPDVIRRTYNDLELTDAAVRAGARAIVIKGHHCGTVARAALCNAYNRAVHGDNSFYMYGGLVLNRETGGLKDSITDMGLNLGGNGFTFKTYNAHDMLGAIDRALGAYANREFFADLRRRCMAEDFGWGRSANEYIRMYREMVKG